VVIIDLKKPDTIAPVLGLKGKGLIKLEVQNVVHGLIRLEIVISVKSNKKEDSKRYNLIKGCGKDGSKNRVAIRGLGTKTLENLRVCRSNNSDLELVTKLKKRQNNKSNNRSYRNLQGPQKLNFGVQSKRFGTKTAKTKAYVRVKSQSRKAGSIPTESYKPLTKGQKKRLERLLKVHLGIGL
jgi:hypothetical protein